MLFMPVSNPASTPWAYQMALVTPGHRKASSIGIIRKSGEEVADSFLTFTNGRLWPKGIIPFSIDDSFSSSTKSFF